MSGTAPPAKAEDPYAPLLEGTDTYLTAHIACNGEVGLCTHARIVATLSCEALIRASSMLHPYVFSIYVILVFLMRVAGHTL